MNVHKKGVFATMFHFIIIFSLSWKTNEEWQFYM